MQGHNATSDFYAPIATYRERFGAMLDEIVALGFDAIDLWIAHCHPSWASDEHLKIAVEALQTRNLRVISLAGSFGGTPEEFDAYCRIARTVGADLLGGGAGLLSSDRTKLVELLTEHDLRFGFENHPNEKTADDILAIVGDGGGGRIGACVDTGWFGTNSCDASQALRALKDHLFYVHLKDVREPGQHRTCAFGEGVVGIDSVLRTLGEIGYTGPVGIEHEPEDEDPTDAIRRSVEFVKHHVFS